MLTCTAVSSAWNGATVSDISEEEFTTWDWMNEKGAGSDWKPTLLIMFFMLNNVTPSNLNTNKKTVRQVAARKGESEGLQDIKKENGLGRGVNKI